MSAQHTQKRAVLHPEHLGYILRGHVPIDLGSHGAAVLVVWKMEDDERSPECEEQARRLVACWNACDGVQTDMIDAAGDGLLAKALGSVGEKHDAMRFAEAERDELLAAVSPLVAMTFAEARAAQEKGQRLMFCQHDVLNPCWDGKWSTEHGQGKHWGGGDACPECQLRAAIAKVKGGAA